MALPADYPIHLRQPARLGQRMFYSWSEVIDAFFAMEINYADFMCLADRYDEIAKEMGVTND